MRYPEFLKDRGTIGFVAPSMGCTTEPYKSAFDNAIKRFQGMGYKTIEGPNCRCDSGIGISNTPKKCAKELNESYASADSDVLISCGGGELMCEVVPYIDFERVKQSKPKWYMGYSDNTNFTFLEATIADTAGIYGPCAGSFGMEVWHESLTDAFDLLCGRKLSFTNYPMWEKDSIKDENAPFVGYNLTEKSCISSIPAAAKENRLSKQSRLSAGEISNHFSISGAAISRHLSVLKEADLIRNEREGKFIYYELNATVLEEILLWINELKGEKNYDQTK